MRIHEYQAKSILMRHGIRVPHGRIAISASDARLISEEYSEKVVIKAQVLVSGRGKAGGIRLTKSAQEAEETATLLLGMEIKTSRKTGYIPYYHCSNQTHPQRQSVMVAGTDS
jgi:succinyl-CoA synthetase beta subunit